MLLAFTLRSFIMLDVIYVGLIVGFFICLALYEVGCEKL
jgi:uncharacterized membrane protein SpoIIM required for sporulation